MLKSRVYTVSATLKLMQHQLKSCNMHLCEHVIDDSLNQIRELEKFAQLGYMVILGMDNINDRASASDLSYKLYDEMKSNYEI